MKSRCDGFKFAGVVILLLAALATSSCGFASKEQKQQELFITTIDAYNSAFRWQDYKQASGYISPAIQSEFWKEADAFLKNVRIMDYEIRSVDIDPSGLRGTVVLNCRFYLTKEPSLKTKLINQTWQYLEKPKTWQVTQSGYQAILAQIQ
jgi:hypothetical protein